jgi:hypothetical protein
MLKEIVLFAVAKRLQSYFCDYLIPLTIKSCIKKLPKVNFSNSGSFFYSQNYLKIVLQWFRNLVYSLAFCDGRSKQRFIFLKMYFEMSILSLLYQRLEHFWWSKEFSLLNHFFSKEIQTRDQCSPWIESAPNFPLKTHPWWRVALI